MAPINRSPFATVAMLMAVGAEFTMAPPPPAVERISPPEPWYRTNRLGPTLPPPYEPPRHETKPKHRSKAERLQRRKKRKQRGR